MNKKQSNPLVYNAIKERGRMYLSVYRELSKRYGEAEAISVMRGASREHGTAVGETLAHLAPSNFEGMAEAWAKSPDDGATFLPDIRQLNNTGLEVKMMRCPLKDSWVEAGCTDEEVCTLLHCASAYDEAVYETAGFHYELELWSPGKEGCCLTKLTEKSHS